MVEPVYYWSLQSWIGWVPDAMHLYVLVENEHTERVEQYTFYKGQRPQAYKKIIELGRKYRAEGKVLRSKRSKYLLP